MRLGSKGSMGGRVKTGDVRWRWQSGLFVRSPECSCRKPLILGAGRVVPTVSCFAADRVSRLTGVLEPSNRTQRPCVKWKRVHAEAQEPLNSQVRENWAGRGVWRRHRTRNCGLRQREEIHVALDSTG
jgi:hypothetical protein